MPKRERSDLLRRRPEELRYYFLAVSDDGSLHVGTSHGSLEAVLKHYGIRELYVSDLIGGYVMKIEESVTSFMYRWSRNYNDVKWNYFEEVRLEEAAKHESIDD